MSKEVVRSRRLRKKLYLDEFAILGFEFTCTINTESDADYEQFFDSFADVVEGRDLFVSLDGEHDKLTGFVSSGGRYSSATEEDRKAIEEALNSYSIMSDVTIGQLVDACYEA
ncbi:50S ribosome-binding protein YggL [Dasania marina]|uniref:50S ribosome-binding protein YggL n=1 Tax=Dasania marina TaxID=471499 RepID=UPI00037DBDAB|nr:50S ribosome-binding protein YggL [Dasania marina]|tara:strand:- start:11308 stop:11646 length:339 start_codon:yes stop_codon:yes gene_type:complete